jgi:GNAT superfamily N-acetyltransferase
MPVRPARPNDADRIAALYRLKQDQQWAPHNRRIDDPRALADEFHVLFGAGLATQKDNVVLVHESDGDLDGFLIGTLLSEVPGHGIGGPGCLIHEFMVAWPELWATVGRALLDEARRLVSERGAKQMVVVCGPRDGPKRALLNNQGLTVVTEYFQTPLD